MMRALVVCPGRGSYDRSAMGQLVHRKGPARQIVQACDAWRAGQGLPSMTDLDDATRFQPSLHVAGEHASLLTAACSLADHAELSHRFEVVGVVGNSMGFYTALAASGALPLDDAIALVDTMGSYQRDNVQGGQVLYPVADSAWQRDPAMQARVDAAVGDGVWWSIDLYSYAVLGATTAGLRRLDKALPPVERGSRTFPVKLPLHSAFHTPVMADTSQRAREELAALRWSAPQVPLVDGQGRVWRPHWAPPAELRDYTLGAQVVDTFDLHLAVRTALRHCVPDVVIALGPGNSLGGPLAAMLVAEGWGGVRTRKAFEARQEESPVLLAFGVPDQRERLV